MLGVVVSREITDVRYIGESEAVAHSNYIPAHSPGGGCFPMLYRARPLLALRLRPLSCGQLTAGHMPRPEAPEQDNRHVCGGPAVAAAAAGGGRGAGGP